MANMSHPQDLTTYVSKNFQVHALFVKHPPQELIHTITDYISSTTDLCTLCEVNKTFKVIVEPQAFHTIHFTIYATSMQRLNNIHESDALQHFMKEIILHYVDMELVGPEPKKVVMEELEHAQSDPVSQ